MSTRLIDVVGVSDSRTFVKFRWGWDKMGAFAGLVVDVLLSVLLRVVMDMESASTKLMGEIGLLVRVECLGI